MVDAVVSGFLGELVKVLLQEGNVLLDHRDKFKKLQTDLEYMRSFFKDAEKLKRKNETLKSTLAALRELVYEAEDILVDCQTSKGSGKLQDLFSLRTKYILGKRLKGINGKINEIKNNISQILGPLSTVVRNVQEDELWSAPVYDHKKVIGIEGDTKKLKEWLFQADSSGILCTGIVGMGGLGKSTLAQTVFNDKEIELLFENRIWVSVSQNFTVEKIMRSILTNFNDAYIGDDHGELLKRIKQCLLGKRFLIVLDDVWSEDTSWWMRICEGLPKETKGCIIVTTRIEEVSRKMGVKETEIYRPKVLSDYDSWELFCTVAFAETDGKLPSDDLEIIGKEIVSKCGGLPLAIKAVGGMMLCKNQCYHELRTIADDFSYEFSLSGNSVMASLQCSYDELPSYLKSCFLSLSIYPEDCEISKDQLVRWWIGEGFVPMRNNRSTTEDSEKCFFALTNRCLLDVVKWDYNGKISTCKVHDMIRDLVIMLAGSSVAHCRHLGITTNTEEKEMIKGKKMWALVSTSKSGEVNKIASCISNKFCDFKYLRVLDLSKTIFEVPLDVLLSKIGCLEHLRCLNLSKSHSLVQVPQIFENFQKLQILDLSYCHALKSLPPFAMNSKSLLVLDVSQCGSLKFLPRGLGKLSNLEVLLGFKPATKAIQGSTISELRSLTHLRILELVLSQADEIDDDETDVLNGLNKMQILTISFFDDHFNIENEKLISKFEKVNPPSQLHELSLTFYPGKISPKWLNPSSLYMLRYLSICGGNLAQLNDSFWVSGRHSWRIEGLKLDSLPNLSMEWEKLQSVMPSLRTVHSSYSPKLVSFPIEEISFRGGVWKKDNRST